MILYDGKIVVFKMESDVMMYVVGDAGENEVLLYNVVLCLRDSLSILLKYVSSRLWFVRCVRCSAVVTLPTVSTLPRVS